MYWLASTEDGRKLLRKYQGLRDKITRQALSHVIASGETAGTSALYWLARSEQGQKVLTADDDGRLIGEISEDALNAVVESGEDAGTTALFWLARSKQGQSVLTADDGELIGMIRENALNAVIDTGPNAGTSALYWLASTGDGQKILFNHQSLIDKITQQGLNQVMASGEHTGKSVLFLLACDFGDIALLNNQPSLINKITRQGLNQVIALGDSAGESPLLQLVRSENGLDVLEANRGRLIEEISQDALNAIVESGEDEGQSALFWLACDNDGQNILVSHRSLRDKITEQGLNQVIASGKFAGESPLYCLAQSEQGQSVLTADNGRLIKMISEDTLNFVVATGLDKDTSALYWLARTEQGQSVLTADDGRLIKMICQETLNAVVATGRNAGTSALYWLASTEGGRRMLAANDELCKKISINGIKSAYRQDDESKSTLMYMLEDEKTRVIFTKVKQLKGLINEIISQSTEKFNKDMLWILTFAPTLISCIDDRERVKGLISRYMEEISPKVKTQILRQYAQTNEGRHFLKEFTDYYPKKKQNEFALPVCVERELTQCIKDDQEEESAPITEDSEQAQSIFDAVCAINFLITINPVRLWSTQADYGCRSVTDISTGNTTGPYDYETIYWHLLSSGRNPSSRKQILSVNQDPDEVIITADDPLMQSNNLLVSPARIKEAIATWLSDRLSDATPKNSSIESQVIQNTTIQADDGTLESPKVMMLLDILQDEHGLGFLMAFIDLVHAKLTLSDFMVPLHKLPEACLKCMLELYCDAEQSMMLKEDSQATLCDLLASTEAGLALLNFQVPENIPVAEQGLFANAAGGGLVSPRNR